jgi:hypothetical protein
MLPCLPTRGNVVAETKFASREAKMFPSQYRNIWCFPMFLTNVSLCLHTRETWRNIGRKQCFRNNVSQFAQGFRTIKKFCNWRKKIRNLQLTTTSVSLVSCATLTSKPAVYLCTLSVVSTWVRVARITFWKKMFCFIESALQCEHHLTDFQTASGEKAPFNLAYSLVLFIPSHVSP